MLTTGMPCASAISALRSSNASRCTSRPALRNRCATGIQNRVWYSASVVIRIVSDEAVMRARGVFRWRCWQAASRWLAHRARSAANSEGSRSSWSGDPLKQAPATEAGSIRLSRRAGLNQVRSRLGHRRSEQQAGGALGDLSRGSGSAACPGARWKATRRARGGWSTPTRTSATRSAAHPSLRWKKASMLAA